MKRSQLLFYSVLAVALIGASLYAFVTWRQRQCEKTVTSRIKDIGGHIDYGLRGAGYDVRLVRCDLEGFDFKSLTCLPQLTSLDVSETSVTDEDLIDIARLDSLENLRIGWTKISDRGLGHIATMEHLKHLNLINTAVTERGLVKLKSLPGLSLGVGGSLSGVKSLNFVDDLPNLHALALFGEQFTDSDLKHLREAPHLFSLNLFGTAITDAGVTNLEALPDLELLTLSNEDGVDVTDASLGTLMELKKLQMLEISDTKITPAGKARLREALPGCDIR